MDKLKKLSNEKKVVIMIFILGLIISFLIPTWQTPDEYSHLNMIGNAIGVDDFGEKISESIRAERGCLEFHYDEKMNLEEQKSMLVEQETYSRKDMLPRGIKLSSLKHIPATIGILLGILLGIPAYWVLQLGELFSLLFYVCICYYALRLMPMKKEVLAFFMLFPMSLQQAGSLNYDATLIPLCFLFISYVFYLKYRENEVVLKDLVCILLMWLLITYIKMPYGALILLVFLIPLNKINICIGSIKVDEKMIKKVRIPVIALVMITLVCFVYAFRHNMWIQILYGFVTEWERGIYLLIETWNYWGKALMTSTVGTFGWLDTPMAFSAVLLIFVVAFLFSIIKVDDGKKLKKWDVLVIMGTVLILCFLISVALVDHTIKVTLFGSESSPQTYAIRTALYQIPYIGGLQGRYYLPIACLFFLPIPQKVQIKQQTMKIVFFMTEFLLYSYVIVLLMQRYWIR